MIRPIFLVASLFIIGIVCPPPQRQQAQQAQAQAETQNQAQDQAQAANPQEHGENAGNQEEGGKPLYEFAYSKYLEEVVKILESDPKFNERLRAMNQDDIKAGNIADQIDDLDVAVFDKLHKAKFEEIERLRQQIAKQIEADGGAHNVKMPDHLDVQQLDKFHKEDLRKLIKKTVADMDELDKSRREDFKNYEMKKQAEEDHKLAQMTPEEREKAKKEHEESEKRHNDHEKLKHPGSRDQLEEVWEESDHLDKDSFDPKTFFALHDLNGDGYWNDVELESLFQIELQRMYNDTDPDDDPKERMEEMFRMREHVSKQMDKNGDRLISLEEFLADTEAQTPNKDDGWKDLGEEKVYTDEELQAFEKEYALKQGWGENAYQGAEVVIPPAGSDHQQPPPVAHQEAQPQVVQNTIHEQPAQQQVHAAQPAQPVQPAQPAQPAQPVHHAPIEDHKKDPTYGV